MRNWYYVGLPWPSSGSEAALSLPRSRVQPLVRELRACQQRSTAKKKGRKKLWLRGLGLRFSEIRITGVLQHTHAQTPAQTCSISYTTNISKRLPESWCCPSIPRLPTPPLQSPNPPFYTLSLLVSHWWEFREKLLQEMLIWYNHLDSVSFVSSSRGANV